MLKPVTFSPYFEDATGCPNALRCPSCGEDYLHHQEVTVFNRVEDALVTQVVTVALNSVDIEGQASRGGSNPSSRRDAVVIGFMCENCEAALRLEIIQHKGQTYLRWNVFKLEIDKGGLYAK